MVDKETVRRDVFARRRARDASARDAAERALARLLPELLALANASAQATVAAYASIGGEPPTRALLDALVAGGADVLLPVVVGDRLEWASYEGWDALEPGERGLLAPVTARRPPSALSTAAVAVVPALAVDRRGVRLGRGGGYYDRALAGARPSLVVAAVYDDEVVDRLPDDPHDRRVDAALTPTGIVTLDG